MLGHHFDRDIAAEPLIASEIDLSHATGAERRDDLVRPQAGARGQWHRGNLPHRDCDGSSLARVTQRLTTL
jgi:hypothetical protein